MNTHDEQPDTYPWRAAPPHLMTRRQLRAAGLAPGGAQPVAVMVRQTRRRRIWAALFDSTQAPAKRTATPAQLEAVAKAVRGRKLRAAERRGLTEADLTQVTDPGPAWTTTHKEDPMSDIAHPDQTGAQDLLRAAAELVVNADFGSSSMVQRKLRIGYAAAEQLMDQLTERGILGPSMGSRARDVLIRIEELDNALSSPTGASPAVGTAAVEDPGLFDGMSAEHDTAAPVAEVHEAQPLDDALDAADSYARLLEDIVGGELDPDPETRAAELLEQEKHGDRWAAMKAQRVTAAEQRLEDHLIAQRELLAPLGTWDGHYRDIDARAAQTPIPEERRDVTADRRAVELRDALDAARGDEDRAAIDTARGALYAHLRDYREDLGTDPEWTPYYSRADLVGPEAAGRGQRMARLHALVAVNRARDHRAQMQEGYAQLSGETTTDGVVPAEVVAIMDAERTAAEARMAEIPWSNPDACSMMLTEALAWRDESPLAAQRADELIGVAASEWGVLIDPETYTVSMDPTFTEQAVQRQQYAEAAAVWTREQYAAEALTEAPLTDAVKDAVLTEVHRWAGVSSIDPNAMLHHADTTVRRRADLATALDSMRLSEADRAVVDFTVDYLRGDLTGVDLLDTPVSVDPGVEARGRIAAMMHRYAAGEIPGRAVAEEIPVLTPSDQETVRELGRAIRAEQDVSVELDRLWPDYIDREDLQEKIALFALNLDEQHAEADFLAEEDYDVAQIGVSDELGERLNELAAHRTELRTLVATGKGLTDIERKQLGATLDDLETGVRGEKTLPEVMYADERTKSDVDYLRTIHAASGIKQQITGTVDQVLTDHRAQVPEQAAATARDAARELGGVVFSIASGMIEGVKLAREQFLGHRAALGRSLAATGIDVTVKQQLKGAVNDAAARGAEMGQAADQRRQRWDARTEAVVAQRNDRLAQRQALAAGRGARSPRIGHQPTRESAEKTGSPAPARRTPVAQRRTTGAEVGR